MDSNVNNRSNTVRIIKDYVRRCGGCIAVDIFINDFREAHEADVPYARYGYSNLRDFINSIPGLRVKEIDYELYIESERCKSKDASLPPTLNYDDVSKICVEMKNNLLLDCRNAKRTVTVRSEAPSRVRKNRPLMKNRSSLSYQTDENEEKSLSAGSVHSSHSNSSDHLASFEPYTGESTSPLPCSIPISDAYNRFSDYSVLSEPDTFASELNTFVSEPNTFASEVNSFASGLNTFTPNSTFSMNDTVQALSYNYLNSTQNACEDWLSAELYHDSYSLLSTSTVVPDAEVIERLLKLINSQGDGNGLSSLTVESKYEETYSIKLPNNWLYLLEETSLVFIENLPPRLIIYPNHWFPTPPTRFSLPSIKYPNGEFWNVYTSSFESTACVWMRLLDGDYDLRYDILRHEMNKHYKTQIRNASTNVKLVSKGELYAVCVKDEWYRCEINEICGKNIDCFLIDLGITKRFNKAGLLHLHEKFTNTPALVIQGSLAGLKDYANCNYINCKVRAIILNQRLKLKTGIYRSGQVLSVRAFLTNSLNSVEVNKIMLEVIETELSLPKLEVNKEYNVTILSVEENMAEVQIVSPCLNLLVNTLQKARRLIEDGDCSNFRVKSMLKLKLNQIYLAKYADDTWQRIMVKQFFAECFVSALFIDFGFIKMVRLGDIVECFEFADTLTFIPPQAVLVKLLRVDVVVLKYLNELQKPNLFSMKVLNSEERIVQFFFKMTNGQRRPVAHLLNGGDNDYST